MWKPIIFETKMLVLNIKYAFKYIYNKMLWYIKIEIS